MKRFTVMSIGIVAVVALLAAGCATTPKGPSDEAVIAQRIQEAVAAITAKNYGAFSGMVSNTCSCSAVGGKDDILAYIKNADSMGFLDDLKIDLSGAKTTIQGEKATVAPVVANGRFGSLTLNFEGIKEKGVWMISGVEP